MALTNKLSAIGDAIRQKTGGTSKLTLDQMVTEIGTIQGGEIIEVESHKWEDWLLSSNIPLNEYTNDRITNVRQYGFTNFQAKTINLPNVTSLNNNAITKCYQLQCLKLPKITSISAHGISDCINMTELEAPLVKNIESEGLANSYKITSYNFPLLETASGSSFQQNTNLKVVDFPKLVSINSTYCFSYCSSLKTVNLPKLTIIGGKCFYECESLESINIPLITSLKSQEFHNCKALKKIDLPSVITLSSEYSFGNYGPFSGCSALETVILRSDTVVTLEYSNIFNDTLIASGTGYIYVPASLVDSYKTATNWVTIANQIRAIEDYPDICG